MQNKKIPTELMQRARGIALANNVKKVFINPKGEIFTDRGLAVHSMREPAIKSGDLYHVARREEIANGIQEIEF